MTSLHDEVTKLLGMEKTASINAPAATQEEVPNFEKLANHLDGLAAEISPEPKSKLSLVLQKMAGNVPEGQPAQNTLENTLTKIPGGKSPQVKSVQEGKKDIPNNPGTESFLGSAKNLMKTNIAEKPTGLQTTITAGGGSIAKSATITDRYRRALAKVADANQVYGKQGYFGSNVDEKVLKRTGAGAEAASNLSSNQAAMNVPQHPDKPVLAEAGKIFPSMVPAMNADKDKKLKENLSAENIAKSKASIPKLASAAQIAAARQLLSKLAETEEGKKKLEEAVKAKKEETPADKIKKEVAEKKKEDGAEKTANIHNLFSMGEDYYE